MDLLWCLVHLIVFAIFVALVAWVGNEVLAAVHLSAPPIHVLRLIGVLVVVLMIIYLVACVTSGPPIRWPR